MGTQEQADKKARAEAARAALKTLARKWQAQPVVDRTRSAGQDWGRPNVSDAPKKDGGK